MDLLRQQKHSRLLSRRAHVLQLCFLLFLVCNHSYYAFLFDSMLDPVTFGVISFVFSLVGLPFIKQKQKKPLILYSYYLTMLLCW